MKKQKKQFNQLKREKQKDSELAKPRPAEKPVSLHPLEFEEAVRGLVQTKPKQKQATPAKR